jgi:K+/H+ antiporter YhaU regulatory subunit KhtT
MKTAEKITLNKTLSVLIKELADECQETLKLVSQLEIKDLSAEQIASILSELAVSAVHLHTHTQGLQDLINDEIERL